MEEQSTTPSANQQIRRPPSSNGLYDVLDLILDKGLVVDAFVRVVRQDPVRKELLYAGTETGLYYSLDGGARWQPLQMDLPGETGEQAGKTPGRLPVVPITDLVVKDRDVVVATQGRSFWILDDVSPLRQGPAAADRLHLYKPAPAWRFSGGGRPQPALGQNPPSGAVVYYTLPAAPKENEEVTSSSGSSGKVMRKYSSKPPARKERRPRPTGGLRPPRGPRRSPPRPLNRFAWDCGPTRPAASAHDPLGRQHARPRGAARNLPGRLGRRTDATESFEVKPDRACPPPRPTIRSSGTCSEDPDKLTRRTTPSRASATRARRPRPRPSGPRPRARVTTWPARKPRQKLTAIEEQLYQTRNQSSQDPLNFPIRLNNKLASLGGAVASADAAPTAQSIEVYSELAGKIDAQLTALRQVMATDLPAFNALVRDKNIPAVAVRTGER